MKEVTVSYKKKALFERYSKALENSKGVQNRFSGFPDWWGYSECEESYEALRKEVRMSRTKRRYLARIAGLKLTNDIKDERLAQVTLKHFFTDRQIKEFSFKTVKTYYSRSGRMKLYSLYRVMLTARRKKLMPRIRHFDFSKVEPKYHEKLKRLVAYFERYLEEASK